MKTREAFGTASVSVRFLRIFERKKTNAPVFAQRNALRLIGDGRKLGTVIPRREAQGIKKTERVRTDPVQGAERTVQEGKTTLQEKNCTDKCRYTFGFAFSVSTLYNAGTFYRIFLRTNR